MNYDLFMTVNLLEENKNPNSEKELLKKGLLITLVSKMNLILNLV